MNATNIRYGDYNFQGAAGPVPLLTINKQYNRSEDGQRIGVTTTMTLDGELNKVPSGIVGYKNIDQMQDALCSGFAEDCKELRITCDNNLLLRQYPRVNSITFSPTSDNWAQTSDFSIELEWDEPDISGFLINTVTETWELQGDTQASFYDWTLPGATGDNNMHLFQMTHTISAKANTYCSGPNSGIPGWKEARNFVITRLGYTQEDIEGSGVFNLSAATYSGWNHARVQRVGEYDGTFDVTETWLVADTGFANNCGNAIEDFTATTSFDANNGLTTTTINGSIQGIEEVSYGVNPGDYTVVQNKYENASGFWECARPKLAGRATLIGGGNVNTSPLNLSVSHNPTRGVISYNYTYDNRPCNFITGALVETITVSDENPTDVFAEIAILGRSYGPVLQDISTVTSSKRTVNINVVMGPIDQCTDINAAISGKPDVTNLLCSIYQDISGVNTQIFKSQDTESWSFKNGVYNRTVQWVYVNCAGDPPNTNFC